MLEQFLLSSPSHDDYENAGSEEEATSDSKMEIEPMFFKTESDKSESAEKDQFLRLHESNQYPNLEVLTEQMDHLSPGKTSGKGEIL
ncbi:hypothetical protein Ancab_021217 [Ancistrocladus abbreviatus]